MDPSRLTRYELELMDVLWSRGEGTVQDVCDALHRPLAYTTVMTTLRLLEDKKKVLQRVKRGRAYVYRPNGHSRGGFAVQCSPNSEMCSSAADCLRLC